MSSARITTTFGRLAVTFAVTEFPAAARLMRSSRRFIIDLATYITPKYFQLKAVPVGGAAVSALFDSLTGVEFEIGNSAWYADLCGSLLRSRFRTGRISICPS